MTAPSLTYTIANGTTADATQVMQNFNDLLNGITDGTKDLSISALTCAGTATFNGAVTLGNATGDDITVTGSLASSIPIKTTNTYDIGSSTKGLAGAYFGTADSDTARVVSAALAASRTYTLPDAGGAADFVMTAGAQTISGIKTFSTQVIAKGTATNDSAATGDVGEVVTLSLARTSANSLTSPTAENLNGSFALTAGDWDVSLMIGFAPAASTTLAQLNVGVSTATGALPGAGTLAFPVAGEARAQQSFPATFVPVSDVFLSIPSYRVSLSGSQTYYVVVAATFGTSTMSAYGYMQARRIR